MTMPSVPLFFFHSFQGDNMLGLLLTLALATPPKAKAPTPLPPTNKLCPVTGEPVNKSLTVEVKTQRYDRKYFICCGGCDKQLLATPDQFLKPDGTPKNAK
jgi:hypothetical protein